MAICHWQQTDLHCPSFMKTIKLRSKDRLSTSVRRSLSANRLSQKVDL